jgi:hypothetical protein
MERVRGVLSTTLTARPGRSRGSVGFMILTVLSLGLYVFFGAVVISDAGAAAVTGGGIPNRLKSHGRSSPGLSAGRRRAGRAHTW